MPPSSSTPNSAPKPAPKDINAFFTGLPLSVGETAFALREFVHRTVPNSTEQLHAGWKAVSFRQSKHLVCSIVPHTKWVNLQFMQGTTLEDPQRLLEGTGKTVRHVKIRSQADLTSAVAALLIQSVKRPNN